MTVQDCDDVGRLLEDIRYRRCWLLIKALHCEQLDRALDLAKSCDDFISGTAGEKPIAPGQVQRDTEALQKNEPLPQGSPEPSDIPDQLTAPPAATSNVSIPDRERLLSRLAQGAENVELAAEFGLSRKQVQGIRMGCTREILRRRERLEIEKKATTAGTIAASIDDVVRYLRQQDDVVVPQETGEFLVNARFRLSFVDLLARANRMRVRQGKPEFDLEGTHQIQSWPLNGHVY